MIKPPTTPIGNKNTQQKKKAIVIISPNIGANIDNINNRTIEINSITITPNVKNKTVGTKSTNPVTSSVVNDSIKATNTSNSTKIKAKPKNIKNANRIMTTSTGIDNMISGEIKIANRNRNGRPRNKNGRKIMNKNPKNSKINGLKISNNTMNPPNKNAPNAKAIPIVSNIRETIKNIAIIAKPPNTNAPANIKGEAITINENIPLNIIVATTENAVIGIDNM